VRESKEKRNMILTYMATYIPMQKGLGKKTASNSAAAANEGKNGKMRVSNTVAAGGNTSL